MKHFVLTVLLCISLAATAAASLSPALIKAHKASHRIFQTTIMNRAGCSSTAIGPQALLTATHCEIGSDLLYVSGFQRPATIVGKIRDENDHTIYLLKNIHFEDYVDVDLNDPKEMGEDVFVFGNPGQWQDQFRKGYITGVQKSNPMAALFGMGEPDLILFDLNGWHGDSGSAFFNADGKIITVLSTGNTQFNPQQPVDSMKLTGGFALTFKQEDLNRARAFSQDNDPEFDKAQTGQSKRSLADRIKSIF